MSGKSLDSSQQKRISQSHKTKNAEYGREQSEAEAKRDLFPRDDTINGIESLGSGVLRLSSLPKTWLFDIDGTLVKHNGFLENGEELLPGVKEFFENLPSEDIVILLTARKNSQIPALAKFLQENNIRFNHILSDLPVGERILINDCKPPNGKNKDGLKTAYAINAKRDKGLRFALEIDENL